MVVSPDVQTNEQAAEEVTQDHRLSSCIEDENNIIKEDLSQHFEADHIKESSTTPGIVLTEQLTRLCPTPGYT